MNALREGDEIIALKTLCLVGDKNKTPLTIIGKSYKVVEVWHIGCNQYDFKIICENGSRLSLSKYYVDNANKYCAFKVLNWERVEKIKSFLQ